jgi:hypothetical protein
MVEIQEVLVDPEGRLLTRPCDELEGSSMVYRAAMGVRWFSQARAFGPEKAGGMPPAQWFAQTVAAVRDELGKDLRLTPRTEWTNVPSEVRAEIEHNHGSSAI